MALPKFLKALWSVDTLFGGIILGAAVWSAMTLNVNDVSKQALTAEKQANVAQEEVAVAQKNIQHVEGRVAEIETKMGEEKKPTVVVRQVKVNETPFRNDAALLERARRVRDAQRKADANR